MQRLNDLRQGFNDLPFWGKCTAAWTGISVSKGLYDIFYYASPQKTEKVGNYTKNFALAPFDIASDIAVEKSGDFLDKVGDRSVDVIEKVADKLGDRSIEVGAKLSDKFIDKSFELIDKKIDQGISVIANTVSKQYEKFTPSRSQHYNGDFFGLLFTNALDNVQDNLATITFVALGTFALYYTYQSGTLGQVADKCKKATLSIWEAGKTKVSRFTASKPTTPTTPPPKAPPAGKR